MVIAVISEHKEKSFMFFLVSIFRTGEVCIGFENVKRPPYYRLNHPDGYLIMSMKGVY